MLCPYCTKRIHNSRRLRSTTLVSGKLTVPSNVKPLEGENIKCCSITPTGHKVDITIRIPIIGKVFELGLQIPKQDTI